MTLLMPTHLPTRVMGYSRVTFCVPGVQGAHEMPPALTDHHCAWKHVKLKKKVFAMGLLDSPT